MMSHYSHAKDTERLSTSKRYSTCADYATCASCRFRYRNACSNLNWCEFLVFSAFVVLFISQILALSAGWHDVPQYIAAYRIITTENEWADHVACVENANCNLCALPKNAFAQPTAGSVALNAVRGSGGTPFLQWFQEATRTHAGVDDCFMGHQSSGRFNAACAKSFFFKHFAMVRFLSLRRMTSYPLYAPTAMIHIARNPFKQVISDWHYKMMCPPGRIWSVYCAHRAAPETDFFTTSFEEHAENAAHYWVSSYDAYESFKGPKMRIYAEDFLSATSRDAVMIASINFTRNVVGPQLLPDPVRAWKCGSAKTDDTYLKRTKSVSDDVVYTPEMRRKTCEIIGKKRWNAEKWGAACVY